MLAADSTGFTLPPGMGDIALSALGGTSEPGLAWEENAWCTRVLSPLRGGGEEVQVQVASHVLPSSALTLLSRQRKKFPELPYWPGREGPAGASTEGPGEVLPCPRLGGERFPSNGPSYIIQRIGVTPGARGRQRGGERRGEDESQSFTRCFSPSYYISASSCVCQLGHPLAR